MNRTIIFGDIHGCYDEWQRLLDKLKAGPSDRLISVGDLIFKGPSSAKVLDLAMTLPNLECVVGNHEYALLKAFEHGYPEILTGYHEKALLEMGNNLDLYIRYIKSWPFYIEENDWIVVHAGIRPGIALANQNPVDLTHLRMLEPEDIPWHQAYKGKKLVVYGHWAKQGLNVQEKTIGLDSGCVYGKKLTALVLPERSIVSVEAKKVYCEIRATGRP